MESESSQRQLLGHLFNLTRKLKITSSRVTSLNEEMMHAESRAQETAVSIADLEELIDGERDDLGYRLRAIYQFGQLGWLRTLFSAQSAHEWDRNLRYLKKISDEDYEFIRNHESNLKSLLDKKQAFKKQIKSLSYIRQRMKEEEKKINSEQKQKWALVAELRKQNEGFLDQLREMRGNLNKDGAALGSLLDASLSQSFFESKGQLPDPVEGDVHRDFGMQTSEKFKYRIVQKGRTYKTKRGTPIRSVFQGLVEFVGVLPGLGKTVILNHGDSFYSVYSHSEDLRVALGDKVKALQVLGRTGSISTDMAGLYFEIRHFSDAVDPRQWIKSKQEQIIN